MDSKKASKINDKNLVHELGINIIESTAKITSLKKGKIEIIEDEKKYTVEQFAIKFFQNLGYSAIFTENTAILALFAIFMHPIIQHPKDEYLHTILFGDRNAFENNDKQTNMIEMKMPSDFGKSNYYQRKYNEITNYIETLDGSEDNFINLTSSSEKFRQFIWAHKNEDIINARKILNIISTDDLKKILRYLVSNFYENKSGWPDIFIYKNNYYSFAEVKSTNDRFQPSQLNWIKNNKETLGFHIQVLRVN